VGTAGGATRRGSSLFFFLFFLFFSFFFLLFSSRWRGGSARRLLRGVARLLLLLRGRTDWLSVILDRNSQLTRRMRVRPGGGRDLPRAAGTQHDTTRHILQLPRDTCAGPKGSFNVAGYIVGLWSRARYHNRVQYSCECTKLCRPTTTPYT